MSLADVDFADDSARQANYLSINSKRFKSGGRIVLLECPICGRQWDVRNRGRETGFIVAAADSHAHKCAREKDEAKK